MVLVKKLRFRAVAWAVSGPTKNRWPRWDYNPGKQILSLMLLWMYTAAILPDNFFSIQWHFPTEGPAIFQAGCWCHNLFFFLFNVGPETIKLLEENIGRILDDINQRKTLYDPPPSLMEIKPKVNKWDLIKLKSCCTAKETLSKVKRQPFFTRRK